MADIPGDRNPTMDAKYRKIAWGTLLLLAVINFLNQVDRRALVALFPLIKQEWALSDAQLGFAVSLFTIGRALMALPAGWLADRKGVLTILRPAVFLWAGLTALSGWVGSFGLFLGLRTGVGLMDGANNPLDLAYLGQVSPKGKRGSYLAIYSIALYLGSGLGLAYAGAIGERFGWRWALSAIGLLGLLAVLGLYTLPRQAKLSSQKHSLKTPTNYKWLLQMPLPGLYFGSALGVFASTALVSWLPSYLTRGYHLSLTQAGFITGGVILPASVVGALLGGALSDRLGKHDASLRYKMSTIGLVLAMLFGLGGLFSSFLPGTIILFFLSSLSFTLPVSPMLVLVQEAVPVKRLATAQAAFGLATQILGAAPATALVGLFSDQVGLRWALVLPFIMAGLGGGIIAMTRKILKKK